MAATPPNPALDDPPARPSTPLTAVFSRLASEPAAASRPAPPPSSPQLLGFAEPVSEVPPIEDFLALDEVAPAAWPPAEIATLEAAPPVLEPESQAQLEALPAPQPPVRARVRDLPPAPAAAEQHLGQPQNLVGRLGRRAGEAPPAFARAIEASPAPPSARRPEPAPVPSPPTERSGRPSLPRNRRLYRRAKLPAEIEIGGVPCTLIDVSIGGFAATGVPPIEPNALVPVTIRLMIDGIEVGTQLTARIVYVTQGRSSGRFIDLGPSQMAFLRYIVTWRGESVGAVGTTTLLDAIANGPDRGFSPGSGGRPDDAPKSRWWAGLIGKRINPPR